MGIETQAVLNGHHSIQDLCTRLKANYPTTRVQLRATHKPDYWLIEFLDVDGEPRVVNAFLNSYTADDYRELGAGKTTLITTEFGATSVAVIQAISHGTPSWFRRHDADPWSAQGIT